jgi:hypothetical protein
MMIPKRGMQLLLLLTMVVLSFGPPWKHGNSLSLSLSLSLSTVGKEIYAMVNRIKGEYILLRKWKH